MMPWNLLSLQNLQLNKFQDRLFFFPQAQVILFLNKQFTAQAEEKTQQGLWQGKVLQTLWKTYFKLL